jgi:hypothetical protein
VKNITRLALALAVAALACLSPMAHADDEAQLVGPGYQLERHYGYYDKDGQGTMVVEDGPKYSWGRPISVKIYQNGYTFYGEGTRSLAYDTGDGYYLAYCEFYVYGSGITAKYKGYMPIKGYQAPGEGKYSLYGSSYPYAWHCVLY